MDGGNKVEQTLKLTNVLSDPTRFSIYQYITKIHTQVTVQEIAEEFDIHPNVARLHLTKLEDVNMLISETQKTGKGGRPSRLYRLSDELVQIQFPFRDFQLLAKIAIDTLMRLGDAGKDALYQTGKKLGKELVNQHLKNNTSESNLSFEAKLAILKESASMLGFYPELDYNEDQNKIYFQINNCPFKEVASAEEDICNMHHQYINGMFESLFENVELIEKENMLDGCSTCSYEANLTV